MVIQMIDELTPKELLAERLSAVSCSVILGHGTMAKSILPDELTYIDLSTPALQNVIHNGSHTISTDLPDISSDFRAIAFFSREQPDVRHPSFVSHALILDYLLSDYRPITPGDRVGITHNTCPSKINAEVWGILLRGGTLVFATGALRSSPDDHDVTRLDLFLRKSSITSFRATMQELELLVKIGHFTKESSVRNVALEATDYVSWEKLAVILEVEPSLITVTYTPDFSVFEVLSSTITPSSAIPSSSKFSSSSQYLSGRLLPNVKAYVADAGLFPVPVGVCGELIVINSHFSEGDTYEPNAIASLVTLDDDHPIAKGKAHSTGILVRLNPKGEFQYVSGSVNPVQSRQRRSETCLNHDQNHHPTLTNSRPLALPIDYERIPHEIGLRILFRGR
jgi:hypothetical protein